MLFFLGVAFSHFLVKLYVKLPSAFGFCLQLRILRCFINGHYLWVHQCQDKHCDAWTCHMSHWQSLKTSSTPITIYGFVNWGKVCKTRDIIIAVLMYKFKLFSVYNTLSLFASLLHYIYFLKYVPSSLQSDSIKIFCRCTMVDSCHLTVLISWKVLTTCKIIFKWWRNTR